MSIISKLFGEKKRPQDMYYPVSQEDLNKAKGSMDGMYWRPDGVKIMYRHTTPQISREKATSAIAEIMMNFNVDVAWFYDRTTYIENDDGTVIGEVYLHSYPSQRR